MSRPVTKGPYTFYALYNLSREAGEQLLYYKNNSRSSAEHAKNDHDRRISFTEAEISRKALFKFLDRLPDTVALLATIWADDEELRRQIDDPKIEPIRFKPVAESQKLQAVHYAGVLAITASAVHRFTEGSYGPHPMWCKPEDSISLVVERLEVGAGPLEQTHTWQDYLERKETK